MATSLQIKEVVSYSRELAPDRLSVILGCSYASLILSSALQQAHVLCGHRKKGHFKKMEVKLPSLSKKWLNSMVSCLHLQEIPYTVSSSSTKFKKIWGLFIEHIRREWPKGGNWLCFIYFFFSIFVFFCMWLWCIVLFLFSIYTWDFDILITAGLPWSPLAQASWSSFFSFFIFFLSVDTLGHLVKWSDMCSCTFSCLCIERVLAVSVCLFWLFVMVFAVWLSLLRS